MELVEICWKINCSMNFFRRIFGNSCEPSLRTMAQVKPFVADNEWRQTATSKKGCQLQAEKASLAMQHKNVIELWEAATISRKLISQGPTVVLPNGQDVSMSRSPINLPIVPNSFVSLFLCLYVAGTSNWYCFWFRSPFLFWIWFWFYLWMRLVKRVRNRGQNILHVINQEHCYLVMVLGCGDCNDKQTQFVPPTAGG